MSGRESLHFFLSITEIGQQPWPPRNNYYSTPLLLVVGWNGGGKEKRTHEIYSRFP